MKSTTSAHYDKQKMAFLVAKSFAAYLPCKALNFRWRKTGKILDLWQNFWQNLHFL